MYDTRDSLQRRKYTSTLGPCHSQKTNHSDADFTPARLRVGWRMRIPHAKEAQSTGMGIAATHRHTRTPITSAFTKSKDFALSATDCMRARIPAAARQTAYTCRAADHHINTAHGIGMPSLRGHFLSASKGANPIGVEDRGTDVEEPEKDEEDRRSVRGHGRSAELVPDRGAPQQQRGD